MGLRTAVAFLTRVPVGGGLGDVRAAVAWLPVAGALIGVAVGGAYAGMAELVPATVAAAVAIVAGLMITGAFHEDGLADVADAFGGGWTREERLAILKDSRHGTYGVAAMCGSIVLRILCLAALGPAAGFAAAVAAHTLGRSAAVATMVAAPTAPRAGLAATLADPAAPPGGAPRLDDATPPSGSRPRRVVGVVAGVAIVVLATGWWAAVLTGLALVATGAVIALAIRKIGGVNGDVLGTVEQVVECTTLIAVTALAARHPLWWR
jgi:adenosylcobinamide-GDP ribazoletransferase